MSRSYDREDQEKEQSAQSRMTLSQGRGGGSDDSANAELIAAIEQAAEGKPSVSAFIDRLQKKGVQAIPSVQASGNLNGMSYRFHDRITKGSTLGRGYTASGLQKRLGVEFEPGRDLPAITRAVEAAGYRTQIRELNSERDESRRMRDKETGLSDNQRGTLRDVGSFRTVTVEDLVKQRYGGRTGEFDRDMRVLSERGLAQRRSGVHAKSGTRFQVVVLTPQGRNLLRDEERDGGGDQQFHAGLVKPQEIRHDIGIYKMFQAEAATIEREGGSIKRVVLDFELKKKAFRELNREGGANRKQEIAEELSLQVVNGKFVFPDLRIEYEDQDQEQSKVDLELATGDYKASQVRAKHAAGLKIYAPSTAIGSPALQDPGMISQLISM